MRTFRVFLSSTFRDLEPEREAFRTRVVPELRRVCRALGADFQAVDLRWGISSEAGLDQRTMHICLTEMRRCLNLTPRPNVVVLLGKRYGWRPVPAEIPTDVFERLVEAAGDDDWLFHRWYVPDTNAIPPVYRLRGRVGTSDDWSAAERRLVALIEDAGDLGLPPSERLMLGASATEQEIAVGVSSTDPRDRVFAYLCAAPDSDGEPEPAAQRLHDLRDRLRVALGGQLRDYEGQALPERLDRFCDDVRRDLDTVIRRELSDPAYQDDLLRERGEHETFAHGRTRLFVGRREPLAAMEAHTVSRSRAPFGIIGASGIGKSSLLAWAATQARRRHTDTVVVSRFAGVTPQSSDVASLLRSLCRELARAYGTDEHAVPQAPEALPAHFRSLLGHAHVGRPLIVFVDALDQLTDVDEHAEFPWVPEELPPYVRLYVSALPTLADALRRVLAAEALVRLEPLSPGESAELLDELLRDAGRTLTDVQRAAVAPLVRAAPSPLYMRLLVEQVRHWRSDMGVPDLGRDVLSILSTLFDDLSRPANHGEHLVSRSLGLLAAARHGLTEDELLDNLSADPAVMDEFRARSHSTTAPEFLPPIVWSRLRGDLNSYLTERGADGAALLTFFHRHVLEVARDRYLAPVNALQHGRLASYFAAQPLYLDADGLVPNLRKLSELVFQHVAARLSVETQEILTSFAVLDARVCATGPDAAIEDLGRALDAGCCTDPAVLEEIRDAIRARAHVLRGDPGQFAAQLTGRLAATPRIELRRLLDRAQQEARQPWLRPVTRSLGTGSDALVRVLGGHQAVVWQVAISPNGRYAVSAGNDNVAVVWDMRTHTALHHLAHEEPTFAARVTPDERRVVCAAGSIISVWDLSRGVRLQTCQPGVGWIRALELTDDGQVVFGSDSGFVGRWVPGTDVVTELVRADLLVRCLALPDGDTMVTGHHEFRPRPGQYPALQAWHLPSRTVRWRWQGAEINSVALANHGRTLLAASGDGKVRLHDLATGRLEGELVASHSGAHGVSVTPDDRYVVAGGADHHVRVWDAASKALVAELKGHRNVVSTTAALPGGRHILSGSHDQEVRLWDLRLAERTPVRTAHAGAVNTLSVSPDGRLVATGSADRLVKLWEPSTGTWLADLAGHETAVWSVAFTPDGHTLLGLANGWRVVVWDLATREAIRTLQLVPNSLSARSLVACRDNLHFFCGGEMFEIDSGRVAYRLPENESRVVAALPDADRILFYGNGTPLRVWSLRHGEIARLADADVAFLGPRRLITAGYELGIWDAATGAKVRSIPTGHRGEVHAVAAFPELGQAVTGSGDHDIALWDVDAGRRLATFTAEAPILCCGAVAGVEPTVVAGDQLGNVHVLRVERGSGTLVPEGGLVSTERSRGAVR